MRRRKGKSICSHESLRLKTKHHFTDSRVVRYTRAKNTLARCKLHFLLASPSPSSHNKAGGCNTRIRDVHHVSSQLMVHCGWKGDKWIWIWWQSEAPAVALSMSCLSTMAISQEISPHFTSFTPLVTQLCNANAHKATFTSFFGDEDTQEQRKASEWRSKLLSRTE